MSSLPESHLLDNLNLPVESRCAALDQWDVSRQAHPVDMSPRIEIVERVEYQNEGFEPVDIKLRVFYVCVMCLDLDVGIELSG